MGKNTWQEGLVSQQAQGTAFSSFTTAKSVINPQSLKSIPSEFWTPGKVFRTIVAGAISNIVTTPGLINFQIKLGSAVVYDTGNIQLNATAHTLLPFWLEVFSTCQVLGSGTTAKLFSLGNVTGQMFTRTAGQTDDAQGHQSILVPQTAPAQGAGFDSTVTNIMDLWAGFTISNAANTVRIDQYLVSDLSG
jgi:hypothetical protein